MEDFEKSIQEASPIELATLMESLFSLDCMKDYAVKESILRYEEQEEKDRVDEYSDEEVFVKYMEFRELSDDPLNLAEYLAERREWEYESQDECDETDCWETFEKARTEHALKLLEEYERRF